MISEISIANILSCLQTLDLNPPSAAYVQFHKFRYQFLLQSVDQLLKQQNSTEKIRILDAGPAFQTVLLRHFFPNVVINTIGINHKTNNLRTNECHYHQDFNHCINNWNNEVSNHDIILFCEVIEHLYTPPKSVLSKFESILNRGGFLIIQTPNAIAIHKRLRLVMGIQPYQLLQTNKMGHFREYTKKELYKILSDSNFGIEQCTLHNYFNYPKTSGSTLFQKLGPVMPPSWRDGLTFIARKKS